MSDADIQRKIDEMRRRKRERRASEPLPVRIGHFNPHAYDGLDDGELARQLRHIHGRLLLRGRLETILARREIGGALTEYARHHPRERTASAGFASRTVGLSYDEGRRHMQLWVYWPQCLATLERLESETKKVGNPFVVPGLRRLLTLAGVVGRRKTTGVIPYDPLDDPMPEPLPNDLTALKKMILALQAVERDLRAQAVILRGDLADARQRERWFRSELAAFRRKIRQMPKSG